MEAEPIYRVPILYWGRIGITIRLRMVVHPMYASAFEWHRDRCEKAVSDLIKVQRSKFIDPFGLASGSIPIATQSCIKMLESVGFVKDEDARKCRTMLYDIAHGIPYTAQFKAVGAQ